MEAEDLMYWLFYLALLGAAGYIMISYVNSASDDIVFRQKVLATNLAFIHDSLDDDFYFKYQVNDAYNIIFDFSEGCKVIVKHRDLDVESVSSCFKSKFDSSSIINLDKPEYILFEAKDGKLSISKI